MRLQVTCLLWQTIQENCKMIDKNVENVREMLYNRMQTGYKKYGVTTERTDIDFLGWLQHLQEELLDAAVYIERLKKEIK
jgi:hypothetical protein